MTIKVTRLERIKEDGQLKRICVGITYENNGRSVYRDWEFDVDKLTKPITKESFKLDVKNHITQSIDGNLSILDSMKAQANAPVITREAETILGADNEISE